MQENEKTKDVLIEQRFHRTIIGTKGEKIREIRDKYPEVQISFPDAGKKSDIVNLRGPREDVDNVYTLLKKLNSELVRLKCWACDKKEYFKQTLKNLFFFSTMYRLLPISVWKFQFSNSSTRMWLAEVELLSRRYKSYILANSNSTLKLSQTDSLQTFEASIIYNIFNNFWKKLMENTVDTFMTFHLSYMYIYLVCAWTCLTLPVHAYSYLSKHSVVRFIILFP